jgi:hypothetical protein
LPSISLLALLSVIVSLPDPPIAFSIVAPLAIVNPPTIPEFEEINPPALAPVNGASFKFIVQAIDEPLFEIVSVPPASQIHDQ